jgi:hypothetical protein
MVLGILPDLVWEEASRLSHPQANVEESLKEAVLGNLWK